MPLLTAFGVIFVGMGVAFGWYGLRPLTPLPRLIRTDSCDLATIDPNAAYAVCRGRAVSLGRTYKSPFTGTACVGLEFSVSERQLWSEVIPLSWVEIDDGVATAQFGLQDRQESPVKTGETVATATDGGTDTVRIDPDSRRFTLDVDGETISVGADDDPSDRISAFVERRENLRKRAPQTLASIGIGARRYTERRIDPGETYLVAGQPTVTDGQTVLSGSLVISDRSRWGVIRSRVVSSLFPVTAAIVSLAIGIAALVLF